MKFNFHLIKIHLLLPFLICQNSGHISAQSNGGLDNNILTKYEEYINKEIESNRLAGAVSLIAVDGKVKHYKAFGYNHLDQKDPMEKDHIFYIQSMTKPIISVAFMMLFEEGHFLLTDPVSKYLPEFADIQVMEKADNGETVLVRPNSPIELWHLLSHTAGFSHGLGTNGYEQKLFDGLYKHEHKDITERVDTLISYPLIGHPGTLWNYSASPDVLVVLIEHFANMPINQFLQKKLFEPLGMDDTGYNVSVENNDRVAGLHQRLDDGSVQSVAPRNSTQGNTVFGGTHGLYSTAEDYFKFAQMVLNGGTLDGNRILGRKTIDLMTADHVGNLQYTPGLGFGLGFGVKTNVADTKLSGSVGSAYWSGLFNTYFFVDQKEDLVGILMSQTYPYTNYYGLKMRQFIYSALE